MNTLLDRISIDPDIRGGKPCIKGTRLGVALILDFLADGVTEAELLSDYPQLTHHDIMAAIAHGAEMSRERVLPVPFARVAGVKIQLDENIGRRGVELLKLAGHDEMTVRDQNLQGARDEISLEVCAGEDRVLITLEHD